MKYIVSLPLNEFKFIGKAKNNASKLSKKEFDIIEDKLKTLIGNNYWCDHDINNLFANSFDIITHFLGYEDIEDFDLQHNKYYADDNELSFYSDIWFKNFINKNSNNEEILDKILEAMNLTEAYEDYENDFGEKRPDKFTYLMLQVTTNYYDLMSYLFDEDCGHEIYSEIPTKRELRKFAMKYKEENDI